MRKLILALMALACFSGLAQAQQQQTSTVDQGKPGSAPWPITWTGQSVQSDLRVGGNPVATGNPVPVVLGAGSANIGSVNVLGGNTVAVKTDGSAVTQPGSVADGADVTQGAKADAAATNATGSWSVVSLLKGIYNGLLAPTPAGTNIIGKVGLDQTTPGTTNGVAVNSSALPTGAATSNNQVTEITNLQAIAQRAVVFMETSGSGVAANNGQYNGSIRDLGAAPAYSRVNAIAYSTQAATISIQACFDSACASNVAASAPVSITAGSSASATAVAITRYYRVNVTNTSTSAATVIVGSSFTAN